MGRKRVQLLVLLTFVVAVTNSADTTTTVTSTTSNTISSTSTTEPASTTTTDPAIYDDPVTLPPPDPSVTEFNYYVRDPVTGVACILANMSISIIARYLSTDGDNKTAVVKIPPTAEVGGTCGGANPTMALIWMTDPTSEGTQNGITFTFGNTGNVSFLQDVVYELYMDNKTFPEAIYEGGRFRGTLKNAYKFVASKNDGLYKCALETTMNNSQIYITITDVALIAFNTEKSVATKTEENCVPENEPATTPLPPPDPSVTKFNYYVRDPVTGVACILANMSISIIARYVSTDGDIKKATLEIPPTAEVRGHCRDPGVSTMELIWAEDPTLEGTQNGIAFMFGSTGNVSFLQDVAYELYMDNKTFPEAIYKGVRFGGTLKKAYNFVASKNDGLYKCALETTMDNAEIYITITDVALIAFNTEKSVATKTEENCVAENEPATTPLPPPDPSVTMFNYYVRDPETGVACILANMSISIIAKYVNTADGDIRKATLDIPPTAEVRGHCRDPGVSTMELIWAEDRTSEGTQNGIALMFNSNKTTFFLQDIVLELYIDGENFPGWILQGERFGTELRRINKFSASKNGGFYRCESKTTVASRVFEITFTNVALIAFNTEESVATRTEEHCDSGADVAQWSGYLLLTANILFFLKLGNQGI